MTKEEYGALAATWPGCDYYDTCEDTERLSFSDVTEALECWIDNQFEKGKSLEELVRAAAPDGITVYGWTRAEPTDSDVRRLVEHAVDAVLECMGDQLEWLDPEGEEPERELRTLFEAAIRKDLETRQIWHCDRTHEIELTLEQLVGIARLEGWFET